MKRFFLSIFLSKRELYTFDSLMAARKIQEFLHDNHAVRIENPDWFKEKEIWVSVFQKRVDKLKQIDFNNKSFNVEIKKRILQNAALSIKLMENL